LDFSNKTHTLPIKSIICSTFCWCVSDNTLSFYSLSISLSLTHTLIIFFNEVPPNELRFHQRATVAHHSLSVSLARGWPQLIFYRFFSNSSILFYFFQIHPFYSIFPNSSTLEDNKEKVTFMFYPFFVLIKFSLKLQWDFKV